MDLEAARHERAVVDRAIDGQNAQTREPLVSCSSRTALITPTPEVRRRIVHDKYRIVIDATCAAPLGSVWPSAA
jgi:hypothetical protein